MKSLFLTTFFFVSLFAQQKELTVLPISRTQLHKIITERNGNNLFLNIWATWCKPCMEEFPDIIKLAEEYKKNGKNIEFVLVSADYPDEITSNILPFLKKFPEIPFRVYVADFESQDDFIDALNKNWSGAVPATFLFSPEGKQWRMLLGQHSYHQFKQEIDHLLHPHSP